MLKIEKKENGFLIENKLFFMEGAEEFCQKKYINLFGTKGRVMNYGSRDCFIIDYPGEFDKNGIFIKVYEGEEDKLNYYIRLNGSRLFLVQTSSILENEEIEKIDYWLYKDEKVEKALDKFEIEGERININNIGLD